MHHSADMSIQVVLDCAPGVRRPNHVLADVLAGLQGIAVDDFEVVGTSFGEWTFRLNDDKRDAYARHRDDIIKRIETAYHAGAVRFASWD